jgi:hypothetical protein
MLNFYIMTAVRKLIIFFLRALSKKFLGSNLIHSTSVLSVDMYGNVNKITQFALAVFFSLILILIAPFLAYAQTNPVEVLIADGSSSPSNDDFFEPSQITVAKGTTVKWINQDSTLHTVTSGKPNEGNSGTTFDSSYLGADKSFGIFIQEDWEL